MYRIKNYEKKDNEIIIDNLKDSKYIIEKVRYRDIEEDLRKINSVEFNIEFEDDEHKNTAYELMSFFSPKEIERVHKKTLRFRSKLRRYAKRRILEVLAIYLGTVGALQSQAAALVQTEDNLEFSLQDGFWLNFVWAGLPAVAYFAVGLRNLEKRYLADD